jgi:hypothetical protein
MPPYPKPKPLKHKKKRKSVSRRVYLERTLDKLVSDIVILRDGGCVTPNGCSGHLTCSHFYPRGQKKVRYSLVNCNCQCSTHNRRHNYYESYYAEYMLKTYTKEQLLEVVEGANIKGWKWTVPELERILLEYQQVYQDFLSRKQPSPPR